MNVRMNTYYCTKAAFIPATVPADEAGSCTYHVELHYKNNFKSLTCSRL